MKANKALIAWTPVRWDHYPGTAGKVKVGSHGPWTEAYSHTGGAASSEVENMRGVKSIARVFIDFHTMVVRDGIDPQVAHDEFLKIDEYAEHMSPDIRGARGPGARAVKRGEWIW